MTTTPTVQQCDRDRLLEILAHWHSDRKQEALDHVAAHRKAATAPIIELLREARAQLITLGGDPRGDDFGDAIQAATLAKIDKALTIPPHPA